VVSTLGERGANVFPSRLRGVNYFRRSADLIVAGATAAGDRGHFLSLTPRVRQFRTDIREKHFYAINLDATMTNHEALLLDQ
jgi:hypothetical protein